MKWWDWMPWSSLFECWVLSQLFDSSLTFIKRLFTSSSLSAIKVVSSAYLRLFIFLTAILILSCASSSRAFLMMYSSYKLNKQGDNTQPWRTPFPIWNQSIVPCLVLPVPSWPAYRFLRRQIRFWYSHLFKNFPQFVVIHTVNKGFSIIKRSRCFSGTLLLFWYPSDVGNLISGYSAFSKTSLNIWKFPVRILLKPGWRILRLLY